MNFSLIIETKGISFYHVLVIVTIFRLRNLKL